MRAAMGKPAAITRRVFGNGRSIWPPFVRSPVGTALGFLESAGSKKISRNARSLSSTIASKKRTSSILAGHGVDRMPLAVNNHDVGCRCQGPRRFSSLSRSSSKSNKRFNLRALPFSISPEEALQSFRKWAEEDQGLRYIMNYNSVKIGAAFVPVWTFDLNIRFKQQRARDRRSSPSPPYSWKPSIFEGYDRVGSRNNQDVIHLPGGLAAYAGYSYRRSLINPVHSTTLIFMEDQTQPFGSWMLKNMVLKESGYPIPVIPDAWNSTQGRAFSVVKEELQGIADEDWKQSGLDFGDTPPPEVQTEVVGSRRILMPTFVIEYTIFGLEYQAFVSGCDTSAPVGGVSHQIFEGNTIIDGLSPEFHRSSRKLLVQLSSGASHLLKTFSLPVLVTVFRPIFSILWFALIRLWTATPIVGVAGGLFAGFRKVLQPWMDNRKASADWERQRQHEAEMAEDEHDAFSKAKMNDFYDATGRARKFFNKNRESILRSLSGDTTHEEGDFDWYSDWQAWAKQQWEQQEKAQQARSHENQQRYQQYYQQEQQKQQRAKSTKKDEYKWPFNPSDPYSVLGIDRNATNTEVSNAFRKEMLQYHPDTQPNATEAQKRRSTERSKLITDAYRKIKTERKARK